ncbi:MAG: hypothetical protein P8X57_12000 [Cyclobacteriaceae bacterium]
MKRNRFIKLGIALPAMMTMPGKQSLVEEFVRAAHNDLARVDEMLKDDPSIINVSYNWGSNDYETAIDGASHVGNRQIAEYLIKKGARPTILTMAMMGNEDHVKNWITSYPDSLFTRGPHGFTLLHHARVGEQPALEAWLQESGLNISKFS